MAEGPLVIEDEGSGVGMEFRGQRHHGGDSKMSGLHEEIGR
jgi:hypothetical protein